MPSFNPLFRDLLSEGWFVEVMGTHESCVSVSCQMFSRDYDEETGYTDIIFGDTDCDSGSLHCVARHQAAFELRSDGPAVLLNQPKQMPADMAAAIAALITPENFPEAAEFMCITDEVYPDGEDARIAFWASINQQVSTMTAAGDPWGALRVQREAVDKLIGWVDPPPEEDHEIPEPNLEDMTPPAYSLIEAADAEQASLVEAADRAKENADYLPVGAHLLPEDFQSFLRGWNKTIVASTGDWLGEPRKAYKRANPDIWAGFVAENKRLMALYPTELAALKAYQASPEGKAEAEA